MGVQLYLYCYLEYLLIGAQLGPGSHARVCLGDKIYLVAQHLAENRKADSLDMASIYVAGDSGGFLNPAITFCFCLYRGLPWRRFPVYLVAQFLGGFCAAGVIYGNYMSAIDYYEGQGIRTGRFSPRLGKR